MGSLLLLALTRNGVTEKTARLLMELSSPASTTHGWSFPLDEFVLGGVEKGKIGRSYNAKKKKVGKAVLLTENEKVR